MLKQIFGFCTNSLKIILFSVYKFLSIKKIKILLFCNLLIFFDIPLC